jgi:hypothetical protein
MLPAIPPETSAARPQAGGARTGCSSAMILSLSVGPAPNSAMSTVLNADFALTKSKRPRQKMRHSFAKARASVVTRNPRTAVADPTQPRWDRSLAQRGGGCATHSCSTLSRQDLTLPPTRAIDLRCPQHSDRPPVTSAGAPAHPYQFTPGAAACRPAWARPGFRRGRFVHSCAQAPLPPRDNHSCGCPGADVAQF